MFHTASHAVKCFAVSNDKGKACNSTADVQLGSNRPVSCSDMLAVLPARSCCAHVDTVAKFESQRKNKKTSFVY